MREKKMKKEHIIRPADAKEYINFQFQGLVNTLEQFDYMNMANMVRATHSIFNVSTPDPHKTNPDCILLESVKSAK